MNNFRIYILTYYLSVIAGFGSLSVIFFNRTGILSAGFYVLLFVLLIIPVISVFFLKLFKYEGDVSLFFIVLIFFAAGLLFQFRLNVFSLQWQKKIITAEQVSMVSENKGSHVTAGSVFKLLVPYLTALSAFFVFTGCFMKRGISFLRYRYFLIIGFHSILLITLFILSKFDGGKTFLFSRTPWEVSKFLFPFIFAGFVSENIFFFKRSLRTLPFPSIFGWGPFVLIVLLPMIVYVLIGDFGQILIYGGVVILLFFGITRNYWYVAFGIGMMIVLPIAVKLFSDLIPYYALQRWEIWWDFWGGFPSSVWWNRNYQLINGIFSITSGGFLGTGFGLGFPALVPLVHSDFIFVGITEEFGLAGSALIILSYIYILVKGLQIASEAENSFSKYLAMNITLIFGVQIFLNIGGVIGMVPLTGITLPFLSRGGSSLLISMLLTGVLMIVSHHSKKNKMSIFYERM